MNIIPHLTSQLKSNSLSKRLKNIEFIHNIPRNGLCFNSHENQLIFSNYFLNEIVSIQYPGKESAHNSKIIRPFDFRPKLRLITGEYIPDLSFNDIWDSLFKLFQNSNNNKNVLKLLSCEFYRIAFMLDYNYWDKPSFHRIDILSQSTDKYNSNHDIYIYTPNQYIIDELKQISPTILGASWESFFMYNDLLALNEDSKYFYNELSKNNDIDDAIKYIKSGTGRINTMLSHIHVLSVILGESNLTQLLQAFARQRGVAPLTMKKLNEFLNDFMY